MSIFHISRHYIGHTQVFTPRIPVAQHKSETEMAARICGSSNIEGCWEGINCCSDLIAEMRKNLGTRGYYFFIYEIDPTNFQSSDVFDADNTGELVSYQPAQGKLVSAFYVNKYKLNYPFAKAAEEASIEEAIEAYAEWQKDDLATIEATVEAMPWEA